MPSGAGLAGSRISCVVPYRLSSTRPARTSASFGAWASEHLFGALKQVLLPLCDQVRMHVELLGELRKGLLAMDRRQRHACLELRPVTPSWPSCLFRLPAIGRFSRPCGRIYYPIHGLSARARDLMNSCELMHSRDLMHRVDEIELCRVGGFARKMVYYPFHGERASYARPGGRPGPAIRGRSSPGSRICEVKHASTRTGPGSVDHSRWHIAVAFCRKR